MSFIEDTGEVIPGAKKELAKYYRSREPSQGECTSSSTVALKSIWPEPDWKALYLNGSNKIMLAQLYQVYACLAPKSHDKSGWKIDGLGITVDMWREAYIETVQFIRQAAENANSPACFELLDKEFDSRFENKNYFVYAAGKKTTRTLYHALDSQGKEMHYAKLLPHLDFPLCINPKKIALFPIRFKNRETGELSYKLCKVTKSGYQWSESTSDYTNEFENYDAAVAALNEFHSHEYEYLPSASSAKPVAPPYTPKKNLGPLQGYQARVQNVSPEQFKNDFGFRGIQFGNYLPQKERKQFLDNSYHALATLCDLLEIPKLWIGAKQLGIAFGARGHGSAHAHYEPDQHVVNLTRHNGPGSIAHEIWHSIDARMAKQWFDINNELLSELYRHSRYYLTKLHPRYRQRYQAIENIFEECFNLPQFIRCARNIQNQSRVPKYWAKPCELIARAFEAYIQDQTEAAGIDAQWLAFGTRESDYKNKEKHPYPCGNERIRMNKCFDKNLKLLFERNNNQDKSNVNPRSR